VQFQITGEKLQGAAKTPMIARNSMGSERQNLQSISGSSK
jgi:hypothetical protein